MWFVCHLGLLVVLLMSECWSKLEVIVLWKWVLLARSSAFAQISSDGCWGEIEDILGQCFLCFPYCLCHLAPEMCSSIPGGIWANTLLDSSLRESFTVRSNLKGWWFVSVALMVWVTSIFPILESGFQKYFTEVSALIFTNLAQKDWPLTFFWALFLNPSLKQIINVLRFLKRPLSF